MRKNEYVIKYVPVNENDILLIMPTLPSYEESASN